MKALQGQIRFRILEKRHLGDIYTKEYPKHDNHEIAVRQPKEPTIIVHAPREERLMWGHVSRALQRLYKSGWIRSYRLSRNGDISVQWFTGYKKKKSSNIKQISLQPLEIRSTITREELDADIRLTPRHKSYKLDTTPKVYFHDNLLLSREVHEYNMNQNNKYMHSEQASSERREVFRSKDDPAYLKNWNSKLKYGNYNTMSDVIADTRPLIIKWEEMCNARGWCAYPSPYYRR
jgi:hypothetical protein